MEWYPTMRFRVLLCRVSHVSPQGVEDDRLTLIILIVRPDSFIEPITCSATSTLGTTGFANVKNQLFGFWATTVEG